MGDVIKFPGPEEDDGVVLESHFCDALDEARAMEPESGILVCEDDEGSLHVIYGGRYDLEELKRLLQAGLEAIEWAQEEEGE